ncbi:hypothetical protein DFH27DRAFT_201473 [Peziza echinospora]|nr:hypothetical protein DFH27DRAFT_201473 [Peziza echinospora]
MPVVVVAERKEGIKKERRKKYKLRTEGYLMSVYVEKVAYVGMCINCTCIHIIVKKKKRKKRNKKWGWAKPNYNECSDEFEFRVNFFKRIYFIHGPLWSIDHASFCFLFSFYASNSSFIHSLSLYFLLFFVFWEIKKKEQWADIRLCDYLYAGGHLQI